LNSTASQKRYKTVDDLLTQIRTVQEGEVVWIHEPNIEVPLCISVMLGLYTSGQVQYAVFSVIKPDFSRISKENAIYDIQIFDAKFSLNATAHQLIQIAVYTLILSAMLKHSGVTDIGINTTGGV